MIYSPQRRPGASLLMIAVIVIISIIGGALVSPAFILFGLIFWFHYTAVLSYKQYRRGSSHDIKGITGFLLKPQARFFIFELLALGGILSIILFGWTYVGMIILVAWFVFSLNFYLYYSSKS
jgi:hypothetical protein